MVVAVEVSPWWSYINCEDPTRYPEDPEVTLRGPRRSPERTCRGLPEDLQSTYTAFLTEAMTTTASSLICWSFVFQQPRSIITIIIMILRVIFKRYHRSWNCCRTFFVIINVCIAHIRSKITFYLILFQFFLIFNACIHWASNCKQQSTNQLMAIN